MAKRSPRPVISPHKTFTFGEEIIESDGKLNFYLQADFDVDAAFGTFVCTDQNDDWLNIYANYDVEQDRLCNTLDLNLCKGDGSEEELELPSQRRRTGSPALQDGGVLPAADRHEPARVRPTASGQ